MIHSSVFMRNGAKHDPFHVAKTEFPYLWRHHSDRINTALLRRWLPPNRIDLLLKTDLFDEAIAEG